MKRCKQGPICNCLYMVNGGYCNLPEENACILQEEVKDISPIAAMGKCEAGTVAAGYNIQVGNDDRNKIKINCDEITLTKDSVGIEVNIRGLIQNIDKIETIEINGRVFKRVKEE